MLTTIVQKLIRCCEIHNANVNDALSTINEHEINLLLELLESNHVTTIFTVKNPETGEEKLFNVEHKSRQKYPCFAWMYADIRFDFSKLSRTNQCLFGEMAYMEPKWKLLDGLVIFDLMKGNVDGIC